MNANHTRLERMCVDCAQKVAKKLCSALVVVMGSEVSDAQEHPAAAASGRLNADQGTPPDNPLATLAADAVVPIESLP